MKTFADLEFFSHPSGSGLWSRMHFKNGYGISVVRFKSMDGLYGSYTNNEEEWEAAVLDNGHLSYDTPITDDVIGHLSSDGVTKLMRKIQKLPAKKNINKNIITDIKKYRNEVLKNK